MKKSAGLTLLLFLTILGFSQIPKDVFPLSREFRKGGLYISPLATISFGNKINGSISDTTFTYDYETTGRGKWSYGLELGWFHSFDGYIFGDYIEGAVSYRKFTGEAEHEGTLTRTNSVSTITSENTFDVQTIVGAARFVDVVQIKANSFLTLGMGINYNYLLSSDYKRENEYPPINESFQSKSTVQGHVQLGYGFRAARKILIVTTVETPLITAYPTDDINPAFTFFDAKYHPVIIGLRFMLLREDPVNCNAPTLMPAPGSN